MLHSVSWLCDDNLLKQHTKPKESEKKKETKMAFLDKR